MPRPCFPSKDYARTLVVLIPGLLGLLVPSRLATGQVTCPGSDPDVLDCNGNGTDDYCDIDAGTSQDCNSNGTPDECDTGEVTLTWRQEFPPQQPGYRFGHAVAYDSRRAVTVLFGGTTGFGNNFADTWEWNGSTWILRANGGLAPPPGRAAYDSARGVTVLFGGGQTWEWDGIAWSFRASGCPTPEYGFEMAYDIARAVTVLFGPVEVYEAGTFNRTGETWEWDGDTWTLRATGAPWGRCSHAMAYDSRREVTVLYGGGDCEDGDLGDTWEWDGVSWAFRPGSAYPRQDAGMAYDSARGVIVLFGGGLHDQGPFSTRNTWEWDGNVWTLQSEGGPTEYFVRMAYDSARGQMVLFGRVNVGTPATWTFGPASSDCNADSVPDECSIPQADCNQNGAVDDCETAAPGFADCNANGLIDASDIVCGTSRDCQPNATPDECELDGNDCDANGTPDDCDPDCNGNGVQDACDVADGTSSDCDADGTPDECQPDCNQNGAADACDVAGGTSLDCNTDGTPDECDIGDVTLGWRENPASPDPISLSGHAMAFDSARGVTVLFGGSISGVNNADTWEWNGVAWTLRSVGDRPSARRQHAMAYDSARGVTVLFGGYAANGTNGETWEWDGSAWSLRATSGPSERYDHAMAFDSIRGVTVLFGGSSGGDTWEWDGSAWVFRGFAIGYRYQHTMAYDTARGVTVLFGGRDDNFDFGDTWEWDGKAWTRVATSGPEDRVGHAMDYDAARGVTMLFGGAPAFTMSCGHTADDTWTWNGSSWTLRASSGPPASDAALAYDSARGETVLFGNRETWIWKPFSLDCNADGVPDECSSLNVDCDQNGLPDACEPSSPVLGDCNSNGVADACDIVAGTSLDCNANLTPDECDATSNDCNANGTPDACDIAAGTSLDCNGSTIPDECETDCNGNATPDDCDIVGGTSSDCNGSSVPDECELAAGISLDCNANSTPDECETLLNDCNENQVPDDCDIASAASPDCNLNAVPDECDTAAEASNDCNGNGVPDECDIAAGTSADADTDGIADECDAQACYPLWDGFEPAPPFSVGFFVDGLDYNLDGRAWDNPSSTWSIATQGCPSSQGKALKAVAQTSPTSDFVTSEWFRTVNSGLDCGADVWQLTFDARSEAQLNPRIDWQMSVRDARNNASIILLHWASTQSSYPGVSDAQGGNGRGRLLVKNPLASPAFINSGFALPANTCYQVRVVLDNTSDSVLLFVNGTLRVVTTRLEAEARRADYFRIQQAANGQGAGGVNRLALDNFELCQTGAALGWSDCNANCQSDAAEIAAGRAPDCNTNASPDECDIAEGTSADANGNGTPDECEAGVPAASVTGADSRKACDLPLGLPPAVTSEPRQGGISEVRIAFDVAPAGPGANPVMVEERLCPPPGAYVPYSGAAVLTPSVDGNELVLLFSPALENARTYRLNISPSVTSVPGQFVEVRALAGDVDSSGRVNGTDRSAVVGIWTDGGFSCVSDLNSDSVTDVTDRGLVVAAWTGAENCAP